MKELKTLPRAALAAGRQRCCSPAAWFSLAEEVWGEVWIGKALPKGWRVKILSTFALSDAPPHVVLCPQDLDCALRDVIQSFTVILVCWYSWSESKKISFRVPVQKIKSESIVPNLKISVLRIPIQDFPSISPTLTSSWQLGGSQTANIFS